jgi:hypothetical protein
VPSRKNPFLDVNDADVLKAYALGIADGTSLTTFHPDIILCREEAATMLTRALKCAFIPGWALASDDGYRFVLKMPALFSDDAKISSWAKMSAYFMTANGFMKVMDNGDFAPRNTNAHEAAAGYANVSREQAIILALRMADTYRENPPRYRKGSTSDDFGRISVDMELLERMFPVFPRSDAADIIWYFLGGFWSATDNLYVGFVQHDGRPGIEYGLWESENRGFGALTGGRPTGRHSAEMIFNFPARAADGLMDALPEMNVTVYIDVSGLDQDGKINIKIAGHGHGDRYTYAYSHMGIATLCACFPAGYETGRLEYRALPYMRPLTVEILAAGLSDWSGMDFSLSADVSGSAVTVDWAADSGLFTEGGGAPKDDFTFHEAEVREWFMLDSLWHTIKENLGVDEIYYTMDGGKELRVPAIEYPTLFPREIPYLGSPFYFTHKGSK